MMSSDIRRLYLFHLFNSIAVCAVANYLFLDKLFLRMELNMSQFGVIKGLSWWLPMVINVVLAPLIARWRADRQVVAAGFLLRVATPFLLLAVPLLTRNTALLTLGFSLILLMAQFFPVVAGNSLSVLVKAHIPKHQLGKHTGLMTALWFIPAALTTIPLGWYVETHSHGSDAEFLTALLIAFCCTSIFQIPASVFAWRMSPVPPSEYTHKKMNWRELISPMRDIKFRAVLSMVMALAVVSSMIGSFMYPYLISGLGWRLEQLGVLVAVVSVVGGVCLPIWGRLIDRLGGRNMIRVSVLGIATGVFCLSNDGTLAIICFALLAWQCETGIFGSALIISRQYLILSMSSESKSNLYLAWVGPAIGTGVLVGSIGGGMLLDWLEPRVHPELAAEHYRIYFTYCALGFLLCGGMIAAIRDGHRTVTAAAGIQQTYRWMRSVIWRGRL